MTAQLLLWTLLLTLSGCAHVEIKDHVIFALKGPGNGAVKDHTLVAGQQDMTQAEWDAQILKIMAHNKAVFCMSSDSFADYKEIEEKLCSFYPDACGYQTKQVTTTIVNKLNTMQTKVLRSLP